MYMLTFMFEDVTGSHFEWKNPNFKKMLFVQPGLPQEVQNLFTKLLI